MTNAVIGPMVNYDMGGVTKDVFFYTCVVKWMFSPSACKSDWVYNTPSSRYYFQPLVVKQPFEVCGSRFMEDYISINIPLQFVFQRAVLIFHTGSCLD